MLVPAEGRPPWAVTRRRPEETMLGGAMLEGMALEVEGPKHRRMQNDGDDGQDR
jgi:hypothetical protein